MSIHGAAACQITGEAAGTVVAGGARTMAILATVVEPGTGLAGMASRAGATVGMNTSMSTKSMRIDACRLPPR